MKFHIFCYIDYCVGILGAVRHEGTNSRLSHYHKTSGLVQMCEESVHTRLYIYKILHCHTKTRVPHHEVLALNIQILNNNWPQLFMHKQLLFFKVWLQINNVLSKSRNIWSNKCSSNVS